MTGVVDLNWPVEQLVLAVAGLAALSTLIRRGYRAARALIRFFQRMEKALVNVEQQLYPNGGSSLRDAVNRIQARLDIPNVTINAHNEPTEKPTDQPGGA
jgi:Flp pilus assembly protein TadB